MKLLRPSSLMGQMLLAVAAALLLVQGLGAFLIYRAERERMEAAVLHGAAFKLVMHTREERMAASGEGNRFRRGWRGFRVERSAASPLRANEIRDGRAEAELGRILAEQDIEAGEIVVTRRATADDPFARARAARRDHESGPRERRLDSELLIAGMKPAGTGEWLVARVRAPRAQSELIVPLVLQTFVIYIVLVGAVALILSRITRPLAAMTGRLERFAASPDAAGQLEPVGPDDVRRLILAHNAMEERITALLDEKDVMLGAIGHDLKTPLAALRVRIESVEDEAERGKMAGTIEDIVRTLDDILSLARVGRPSDEEERTELSALVASVVEEYEDMGDPVELGHTERIVLGLRATWLRRALRNLIGNALRYGDGARVSVRRIADRASITIEDDGPGIPEDRIETMMHPFMRGDPSRNTETGGAGLGLALARAIADQHGGHLFLANRTDAAGQVNGLTATLELPIT